MDRAFRMLIDGELVDGASRFDVVNPATAEPFASCPKADAALVDRAVAAAKAAFPAWSARPIAERAALIDRLADTLEHRAGEFASLLTSEQGKPLDQAMYEVMGSVFTLRAFAAMRLETKTLRDEGANLAYWNSFFDEVDEGIRRDNLLNLSAMTREERREALSKGEE